jgi:hypothetical protein
LDSSNDLPKVCKTCIIRASCKKKSYDKTLCQEAHDELREFIFLQKEKTNEKNINSSFIDISHMFM